MDTESALYTRFAAAYVRGTLVNLPAHASTLVSAPLDALDADQCATLIAVGHDAGLRLHRFKRTMVLPRVHAVLGILKGMAPTTLLDIGSGRGAFLWPLLDAFPWLPITALDRLDHRVRSLQAVRAGGVETLTVQHGDATCLSFPDHAFDVVTMLEVLEHIPDTARALAEVCRVAQRFVVLSVPSKPDTNPEHIHLFDATTLEQRLRAAGAVRVSFDYVPGHMLAIAKIGA